MLADDAESPLEPHAASALAAPTPPIPARTARRETRELIIERASGESECFLAMMMGSFFSGTRDGCAGLIM